MRSHTHSWCKKDYWKEGLETSQLLLIYLFIANSCTHPWTHLPGSLEPQTNIPNKSQGLLLLLATANENCFAILESQPLLLISLLRLHSRQTEWRLQHNQLEIPYLFCHLRWKEGHTWFRLVFSACARHDSSDPLPCTTFDLLPFSTDGYKQSYSCLTSLEASKRWLNKSRLIYLLSAFTGVVPTF